MSSVHEQLEDAVRNIRRSIRPKGGATPSSLLEVQIAFLAEQVDRVREVHQDQLRRLLRAECYVDTDLLQHEGYAQARLWPERTSVRDHLKTKLGMIDQERRRLLLWYHHECSALESRLLELICQRALLDP